MKAYWHSVFLHKEKCTGCTNCMHKCPTQAIRVIDGKAKIIEERCIDCGECIKVCPFHAKDAKTDVLSDLANYRYKVALPATSLYGQFPTEYDMNRVMNTFLRLGFDEVFDVSRAADIISAYLNDYVDNAEEERKPLISTYCPAVTRLIQIRYPSLIDNIITIESPSEVAARQARQLVKAKTGLKDEEIGIFLITECPAKVTSIYKPLGLDKSQMTGAVSLKSIYPRMLKLYDSMTGDMVDMQMGSGVGIGWGRVGGQSYAVDIDNYIAVDGIDEVTKVLDKVDLEMLRGVDFIEGYACVTGCCGGPLNVENPFIAKSRIRKQAKKPPIFSDEELKSMCSFENIVWTNKIEPHQILKLDKDFKKAIEKMTKIEALHKSLPGLDCGACGSPTCRSLAEDVVLGRAKFEDCIVRKGAK
ncbi:MULTISPECIES: [Fe-Fe] hydrogenase large subunit C-terminal domain-containing protein [unclassified Fusibacter]|uniref:[Fe-Fe] hydrogenase large subunit C-terminal domain-containing protein n=1 Tax=unclassified Fusibacter TaxID=2624464 RepID=UPI0010137E3C|nr:MULTISPECIES: [Fe-Fe] hydrogenase large subunit C-terminal domain-containing protein [unclassified Fusibacter]MCK8060584.1 4Fe-4S dicluster domain-containing protein [Fusibacter sp. A2]NPE22962.1 4Fe-4S dicluster domain-containing protein [Fusibacter sp. A1]RXV60027.1 4Fe-4S dicluster domain-containing protein [Fusibacter sp. A1]